MCDSTNNSRLHLKAQCGDCQHQTVCKYVAEYDAIATNTDLEHLPEMIELDVRCKYFRPVEATIKNKKPMTAIMGKETGPHPSGINIRHTKIAEHSVEDEI